MSGSCQNMESLSFSNIIINEDGSASAIIVGKHGEEKRYILSPTVVQRAIAIQPVNGNPSELRRQKASFNDRADTLTVTPDRRESQLYNPYPSLSLVLEATAQAVSLRGIEPYRIQGVLAAASLFEPDLVQPIPSQNLPTNNAA